MCSRSGQPGGRRGSAIWRTGPRGHKATGQRPRYLPLAVLTRRQPFADEGSALDHLLTSVSYAVGYRQEAGQMGKMFDQRQGGSVRGSQHGTLATKGNWPRRRGRWSICRARWLGGLVGQEGGQEATGSEAMVEGNGCLVQPSLVIAASSGGGKAAKAGRRRREFTAKPAVVLGVWR
jgi:hypothetical protein